MATRKTPNIQAPPAHEWPTYWFARMHEAVRDGKQAVAEEARQHLARLGWDVTHRQPQEQGAAS